MPKNGSKSLVVPTAALVHELQVRQNELEAQNEHLRQMTEALEASNFRYQDLYDLAPFGYLSLTHEGRIAEINLLGANLLGHNDPQQLAGSALSDFFVAEEFEHWQAFFNEQIVSGGRQSAEFSLIRSEADDADGRNIVQVRIDCLRIGRPDPALALHVALVDISESKQISDTLREQKEFFRLITENINGFIAVLDTEGRRLYNSPSYTQLFGDKDMVASDSFAEIHPDDRERVAEAFRQTVATGIGTHLVYRFIAADCCIRQMESRGGVIRDRDGRVKSVVVISNDITERMAAEERIYRLAFYDALTGVPNRLALSDRLQHLMAASKRSGRFGALMFLDLDHFKPINDQHGHSAGDRLLCDVALRIGASIREMDTVARFGGDEFVVVIGELDVDTDISHAMATAVAEKIQAALAEPFVVDVACSDGTMARFEHRCTVSIGIVLFRNHESSEEELLRRADIAMYTAKEKGRNRICFAP